MTRTGRCACGAVRFETDAEVLWAGHCHCESCRRACSAPMTSFFGVRRDSVRWSGPLSEWASSAQVRRGFCGQCGSQMHYQNSKWPDETHLYAAALDDPTQFDPKAHYHFADHVPWLDVHDDLPRHTASADDEHTA